MDFHGGGLDRGEPTRKHPAQRRLERKRRAVVDHDVLEPGDGSLPVWRERLDAQLLDQSPAHPAHEHREPQPREAIVERLVRDLHPVLVVEHPEQVGQRFHVRARERGDDREE
jgi:hypothetical protein